MDSGQFPSSLLSQESIASVEHDNGDGEMPHRAEDGAPAEVIPTNSILAPSAFPDDSSNTGELQVAADDSTNGMAHLSEDKPRTLL
jgi:hypothetical protein